MAFYRESFELARRIMGDKSGVIYKEGGLFPLMVEALRKCQRTLAENGMPILRGTQALTVPQGATSLSLVTVPALAADFVLPWELEEKDGGNTGHYKAMTSDTNLLPDVDQTSFLRKWNWRGGTIQLIGATRNVDIRINYERELAAPTLLTDTIPIIGASSAIAYYTAFLTKGDIKFQGLYEDAIHSVIASQVRADQYKPVRRIPYRYR